MKVLYIVHETVRHQDGDFCVSSKIVVFFLEEKVYLRDVVVALSTVNHVYRTIRIGEVLSYVGN